MERQRIEEALSTRASDTMFEKQSLALASGAWAELGVSGWAATHHSWAIDAEPLIIFTAWLGDADRRMRDETTDWCIRNWRHISKTRLKNLLHAQPAEVRAAFGEFSATVGEHASIAWPNATSARPFTMTGRSALPRLDRPSMAWLRLRAMFGVSARSEILRCFLSNNGDSIGVARLATLAGYGKRNVAEECDGLERAGLLSVRAQGNRFQYSLSRRRELEGLIGELPPHRPNWVALLNITRELVILERWAADGSPTTLPVHARSVVDRIGDDLDELGIEPPSDSVQPADLWPALRQLGRAHLGAWST
ncbi:MAG: hypothetical protein ACR2H3_03940, partial [Acidimicrobiales bacterium]